jgi:hypothetical protein
MDTTLLEVAAHNAGVLPSAIEDAVRRLQGHFAAQAAPSPELLSQQLLVLKERAPHLFPREAQVDAAGVPQGVPPEVWRTMAPSSKLTWLREHGHALPVEERRPTPLTLTSAQIAAFAAMSPTDRTTAYRAMQAEQQKG